MRRSKRNGNGRPRSKARGSKGANNHQITIDRRLAGLLPQLTAEERAELEESLLREGCRDPLVVWRGRGVLVDGHNRMELCSRHDIAYQVVERDFSDEAEVKLWMLDNQRARRNLSPYQRIEIEMVRQSILSEQARARQKTGKSADGRAGGRGRRKDPDDASGAQTRKQREAMAQAAARAGVSTETFRKAKAIKSHRIDNATEDKLRRGELSIHSVHIKLQEKAKQEKTEQTRREAAGQRKTSDKRIIVGDYRKQSSKIPDGSANLIFTDPPYHWGDQELDDLGAFAASKLCEGGSLVMYVGVLQLPAALMALSNHLRYWWTAACVFSGSTMLMREYGVRQGWRPFVWFVKGTRSDKSNVVHDVVSGKEEKASHEWQQAESEAGTWIEHLCPPGGLVIDPLLGSGTTAVAAERMGREWIGIEIDRATAAIAGRRVREMAGSKSKGRKRAAKAKKK